MLHELIWLFRTKTSVSYPAPVAQNKQRHNRSDGNSEIFITPDIVMLAKRAGSHRSINSSKPLEEKKNLFVI